MRAQLVTIGTELLLGLTVDTNAAWIGQALASHGIRLDRRVTVGDDPVAIREAVREALARADLVLTTGGLGPTRDDLTKHAVAGVLGRRLVFREEVWAELEARYARLGRPLSPANRTQADLPEGAVVLSNPRGTAPGIWIASEPGLIVMLPGVPREMRGLMTDEVLPRLAAAAGVVVRSRTVRTAGIPESNLAAKLAGIEEELAPLTLAYLPEVAGVDLRVTAWELSPEEADRRLEEAIRLLRARLPDHAYGEERADLAEIVLAGLRRGGHRLAVAESCTGGLLGARLTAVPGSSDGFAGGVIVYENAAKIVAAGVPEAVLQDHGAVSEEVARALATGAARNFSTDTAVGITGIAGPSGGTAEKPVGTVCVGYHLGGDTWSEQVGLPGNRAEIRERAVQLALHRLWRRLSE